jgi:hypothetical protein
MRVRRSSGIFGGIVAGSILLALASPGAAHHGEAGLWDETRTVEVRGTVKEWYLVNPHPVLVVEITDENGETADWDVYFGPFAATSMRKRGFSDDMFVAGEMVIIKGHAAAEAGIRGINVFGAGTSLVRADGSPVL